MEFIFEAVFQVLAEFLLQIFAEMLVEVGLHALADGSEKPRNPVVAAIGYIILGIVAGAISLLIFPTSLLSNPQLRMANLIVSPLIAGLVMTLIGRLRDRRGQDLVRLDRFGYAFVFALSMALVRFYFAR